MPLKRCVRRNGIRRFRCFLAARQRQPQPSVLLLSAAVLNFGAIATTETAEVDEEVDFVQTFFIIMFTIMAFSFVPAAWIMYIVREKDTKCKHQQVR